MALDVVKEHSAAIFRITFEDPDGGAIVPETIHYIVGKADGTVVVEETEVVSPAAEVEITIPPDAHVITGAEQQYEMRVLHVVADKDEATEWRSELQYQIENLVMIVSVEEEP
jgi:hypothetical protein